MIQATTIGALYPYTTSPAEAVRMHAGTGFKYLDYSFYDAYKANSPYYLSDDRAWRREVEDAREAAQELGFTFVQAHAPGYNPLEDGADEETGIRSIIRSIDACGILGIHRTVLHTTFSPLHLYPQDREAYFEYNLGFVRKLLPAAERNNVTICVENSCEKNMGRQYFFMTPEEMNSFIAKANHPLVGACWDIGHALLRGHQDQYQDILELGSNLKAVHIHDNYGDWDRHIAPGMGIIDLDSVVRALRDINFPETFTFEADSSFRPKTAERPCKTPSLAVMRAIIAVLYQIGKSALEARGCFDEQLS